MGVRVNPWLSKAPMSTVPFTTRALPRWSVAGVAGVGAGVDGRAARQQRHGLGRPAVVAQRAQAGGLATPTRWGFESVGR